MQLKYSYNTALFILSCILVNELSDLPGMNFIFTVQYRPSSAVYIISAQNNTSFLTSTNYEDE